MLRDRGGGSRSSSPKKSFTGVRFVLFGFDSVSEAQYRSELVDGGGVDVGRYDSSCTHVIVSGRVFDDPICVATRKDGKILVTELWIDDSLDFGMLADSTKVLYRPVRDLSGIPGSESLHICLTGYQRQERDDIMRMVSLMGGRFSKPLIANQVTHLICYKFEGEKYELAKKVNIKLVNHRWLEDCLKSWEILPIDNYKKSGWELEMLEAEAMDSEEEAEVAGREVTEQRSIAQPCSLRGEMSVNIGSDALVNGTRNLDLQKTILAAKPSDLSVNNLLIATPHKESSSGKASDICDSKVLKVFGHLQGRPAEELPDNHGMDIINSKQPNIPDLADLSMKCNGLPPNVRNNLMCTTSCEEGMKLSPPRYSRKTTEKAVSPNEQFNNLCTPRKGKSEEVNLKEDVNISSAKSKDDTAKKCIYDNLHSSTTVLNKPHMEGQIHALPQKRKLSVSKVGSKSIKSDQVSRTSGLLNAQTSINSAELDSLKLQRRKAGNILTHNETSASICVMAENNDVLPQMERLLVSSTCLGSPELAQKDSATCMKQSPSTSTRPGQIESMNIPNCEVDHGLTHADDFEGTALVQPRVNQCGPLSKSSSLSYKRKFLKHWHSDSVTNISANSSSISDNKGELLSVPSKTALDGTLRAAYEPVSEVGAMCGINSPEATALSDCSLNNETGLADNRSTGNDPNFLRSTMASDGENANEAPICVRVLEASLKNTRKSETAVKSQDFGGVSMKSKSDIHNEAPEQNGSPGEDQEVLPSALRDTKVKGSVSTEIPGSCKESKSNEGSIHGNRKVLVSRNMGCRPKTRRKNGCKNNNSSDSCRSINLNETAIKLGNEDCLKEKVAKEDSTLKEKAEVEQYHPRDSGSNVITQDTNCLDPEKENKLKDSCNLFIKEGEGCGHKVKKRHKPVLGAKRSGGDNINSLPKLNCPSAVIPDPVWFILSGSHVQRKEFQIIIKRLRGRICRDSHNWTYQATHFIVPDFVRRTEKFFAAAAAGRWILRSEYLTASGEAGKFLDEEPFEWHRNGLTEDGAISLEAPRKWRTLRERTGHGVFYGMRIIIYGECIAPPRDTLKRVVKAGDGTILATSPPYTKFLKSGVDFAIVSASMPHIDVWVQEFLRHEIPCVLADYLVEYVCKPGYSLERHVLYNTHTWAEKSVANLLIRSEEVVSDKTSIGDSSDNIKCVVCGSQDRGEVMLICGDEAGNCGCGVGTHIDCCDPPLVTVPEDDWFCSSCSRNSRKKTLAKTTKVKLKKRK